MHRIINDKGTGKTVQLMSIAKENNAIFVCYNPNAMKIKAKAHGIEDLEFMSYTDFIRNFDPEITAYVIDELELFVNDIFANGPQLIGYTLSIEN